MSERQDRADKRFPARRWHWFGMTRRGRMSWAGWFHMRANQSPTKGTEHE